MDRKYQHLRPAPPPSGEPSSSSTTSPAGQNHILSGLTRRRRVGNAVACQACRKRKTRCDGQLPACYECQKRGLTDCSYERSSSSGSSSGATSEGESLIEAVALLNAMNPHEVSRILATLQNERNPSFILASLRSGVGNVPRRRPSTLSAAAHLAERTVLSVELEARHPFVFPTFLPVDLGDSNSSLQRLLEPYRKDPDTAPSPPDIQNASLPRVSPQPYVSPLGTDIDERLVGLNIGFWTDVPVDSLFAARVISLYFETDHSLLGSFKPDPFIHDLVALETLHCSSLLVNALMYWACQMYTSVNENSDQVVEAFGAEAERLWALEHSSATTMKMIAAQFLSLSYMVRGRDHVVLRYLSDAARMGISLGLFGVEQSIAQERMSHLSAEEITGMSYTAWGVFNWITFMGVFYHQPGVQYPKHPPTCPVPEEPHNGTAVSKSFNALFPVLCNFWRIMNEVALAYYTEGPRNAADVRQRVSLQYVEFKFRELLAWADTLPSSLARTGHKSHLVITFHLWLHAAILDMFRPFLHRDDDDTRFELKTFNSSPIPPDAVYAASVNQLKRLIVVYRYNYESSVRSIIWHTALIYVANAMLQSTSDEDWLTYFLLCLYGYSGLRKPYRVAEIIPKGLLSMAMRNGEISGEYARHVLEEMEHSLLPKRLTSAVRATFMGDLDLAMSEPGAATIEGLAGNFDDNAMMTDFTNVFEDSQASRKG